MWELIVLRRYDEYYWQRLDNVARLYAAITTYYNPNLYRIAVKLKEKIVKSDLIEALNSTLITIPSFNVKLRHGFFWYFFEKNMAYPIVEEEENFPYVKINIPKNNDFLFKVTYFKKRISIDISHSLTDGMGASRFVQTLIFNYLKRRHPRKVDQSITVAPELFSKKGMIADSFAKYIEEHPKKMKTKSTHQRKSYTIKGIKLNIDESSVIIGTVSVVKLKALTKAKNVTITAYLTAVLLQAIYEGSYKYSKSKLPITICIPVDLRNYFPTESMNNFFTMINISVNFNEKVYSFDELITIVSKSLTAGLNPESLANRFRYYVGLQQNIFLRFIPLIIKDALLKISSDIIGGRNFTATLTNLGIVDTSNQISEYIDKFDFIPYSDKFMPLKLGVCSFGDKLSMSFPSLLVDTEIQRSFFSFLSHEGLDVDISGSLVEYKTKEGIEKEGRSNEIL